MLPVLSSWIVRLERRKQALFAELGGLPPATIASRPAAATWSMLDVAEHLMKVEEAFIRNAAANLRGPREPLTVREKLGALGVWIAMRLPTRIPTPGDATRTRPSGTASLTDIAAEWTALRDRMRSTYERITPRDERLGVVRHPVSGWLTPSMSLRFLDSHFAHHDFQLNRLKKLTRA